MFCDHYYDRRRFFWSFWNFGSRIELEIKLIPSNLFYDMVSNYGNREQAEQAFGFDKNVTTNEWMNERWTTDWLNETRVKWVNIIIFISFQDVHFHNTSHLYINDGKSKGTLTLVLKSVMTCKQSRPFFSIL